MQESLKTLSGDKRLILADFEGCQTPYLWAFAGVRKKVEKISKKVLTNGDEKGPDGKLLPDEVRLTSFGKWLRSTSLDELPELINYRTEHYMTT